jgi:hypothetical protein
MSYRLIGLPRGFLPTVKFQDIEWQETSGQSKNHAGVFLNLRLTVNDSILETEAIPMVHAVAHNLQSGLHDRCRLKRGVAFSGKCWVYSRLSRMCLQVDHDGSQWHLAHRVPRLISSYGCEFESGNWTATVYEDMHLVPTDPTGISEEQGLNHAVSQAVVFDDLEIVVRSAFDPHLKAIEVTQGSLDFGMTSEEERWLGAGMIIIAVLLAVPPVCALGLYCRKRSSKRKPRRMQYTPKKRSHAETVGMKYAVGTDDEIYDIK